MKAVTKKDLNTPSNQPVFSTGFTGEGLVYDGGLNVLTTGWSCRGFIETLGFCCLPSYCVFLLSFLAQPRLAQMGATRAANCQSKLKGSP